MCMRIAASEGLRKRHSCFIKAYRTQESDFRHTPPCDSHAGILKHMPGDIDLRARGDALALRRDERTAVLGRKRTCILQSWRLSPHGPPHTSHAERRRWPSACAGHRDLSQPRGENRAGSVRAARFCVFASHCFAGRSAHTKCLIDIN